MACLWLCDIFLPSDFWLVEELKSLFLKVIGSFQFLTFDNSEIESCSINYYVCELHFFISGFASDDDRHIDDEATREWVKAYLEAKYKLEGKDLSTLTQSVLDTFYAQTKKLSMVCLSYLV